MRNVNSGDDETNSAIQNYIGQIEELNNKLAQAAGIFLFLTLGSNSDNIIYILARAARPRIGSARESFLSNSSHEVLEKARKALETQRLQSDSTSTLSEGEDEDDIDDIENQIEENEELQALESKVAKRKEQIVDIRYLFICLLSDIYLFFQ